MKRLMLAAGLAGLAVFPAGALASPSRAKVLSASARHHTVRLVDSTHIVRAYRYRGTLPHLNLGDSVSFRHSGNSRTISHVRKTGRAFGAISFYAKVVRSGAEQARLRLGDGSALKLSSKQVSTKTVAHAAAVATAPVTIQVQGLTPGETVLITETVDAGGHWTITLTLPTSSTASGGGSTSGDGSGDHSGDDQLAEGTISRISASALTVNTGSQSISFSVDPSEDLTAGFLVGDVVDVTYYANGDGSFSADDVEYVEQDATGVVSAVSDGSLTLVDDATGQPDAFSGDPELGLFDGVNSADHVDVTYHQSASGLVADAVGDDAWDA